MSRAVFRPIASAAAAVLSISCSSYTVQAATPGGKLAERLAANPAGKFAAKLTGKPVAKPAGKAAEKENKSVPLTIHDKWAVVAGVGHYQDSAVKPIKYATRNVLALTEALCDPQAGHFLPDHVLVATEDKVTKDSLEESTWNGWLAKKALPNDIIVLYFCMRFVPTDDASDILLLSGDSKVASKEGSGTSLSSLLGEVRRRTQCKNIVAMLDLSPTDETAKNFKYGFGSLLKTIGEKSGVTIFAADERLLGSLDDDGIARTSAFVECFCQALKAGGGSLSLEFMTNYVAQALAQAPPAAAGGYNSHPILLASPENPELLKTAIGMPVKNPNPLASIHVGKPISEIAKSDPALAAHLETLSQSGSANSKFAGLRAAADREDQEREEEEDDAAAGQEVDFTSYMANMKKSIQAKWATPKGLDQKTVIAVFSIEKDGSIKEPEIVESSGSQTIDQSALKALADASPLPPLPKGAPKRIQIRYKFDWKVTK